MLLVSITVGCIWSLLITRNVSHTDYVLEVIKCVVLYQLMYGSVMQTMPSLWSQLLRKRVIKGPQCCSLWISGEAKPGNQVNLQCPSKTFYVSHE